MTIKVVRGLIGQAKSAQTSASNTTKLGNQTTAQVVRTGQAYRSEAAVSSIRQFHGGSEAPKVRDSKEAKYLAKSVANELHKDPELVDAVHNLRPSSGKTTL